MARSFSPRLTASASRALPFIESAVSRGLSTTALQRELSAAGLGVRRQDLLDAVRSIRQAELAADHLKSIRRGFRPNPERLPHALTRTLREYSFRVRVSGYDISAGENRDRYFNISSNSLLSRDDIESIALGYAVDDETYTPFEPEQVDIVSAVRR